MRRADQRPFALHLLEASQRELLEAAGVLDLSDDWRDLAFAGGVDRRAGSCQQLAGHSVDDGGVPGSGPRGHGPGRSPCLCFRVEMDASIGVSAIAVKFSGEQ